MHFATAYGGNGISYSMLGAGRPAAHADQTPQDALAPLFSFARLER